MTPRIYYQDADCILWHADCRDVLARLEAASVDLVLTDPPYGVDWQSGRRQQAFDRIAGDDSQAVAHEAVRLALPALKRRRHLYVFGLEGFSDPCVAGNVELVWDKGIIGPGDLTLPWGPSHERIWFGLWQPSKATAVAGDGRLAARLRQGSVLRCDRINGAAVVNHPTEKPVPILRQMIESSTVLGETVLDPFAGSGSTLVAAKLEGRKSIGIEIDERYCAVAARRLAQQVLPLEFPA